MLERGNDLLSAKPSNDEFLTKRISKIQNPAAKLNPNYRVMCTIAEAKRQTSAN
jgi:ABC-type dipeptide/oligopeptide/nickel transport system ATPase component